MPHLVFTGAANADLDTILRHLAHRGAHPDTALSFVGGLRARCRALARLPGTLGRARPELGAGLRSVAEGNYVIFFRYARDSLEVVNIIEGHRDLGALFGDDEAP